MFLTKLRRTRKGAVGSVAYDVKPKWLDDYTVLPSACLGHDMCVGGKINACLIVNSNVELWSSTMKEF